MTVDISTSFYPSAELTRDLLSRMANTLPRNMFFFYCGQGAVLLDGCHLVAFLYTVVTQHDTVLCPLPTNSVD